MQETARTGKMSRVLIDMKRKDMLGGGNCVSKGMELERWKKTSSIVQLKPSLSRKNKRKEIETELWVGSYLIRIWAANGSCPS